MKSAPKSRKGTTTVQEYEFKNPYRYTITTKPISGTSSMHVEPAVFGSLKTKKECDDFMWRQPGKNFLHVSGPEFESIIDSLTPEEADEDDEVEEAFNPEKSILAFDSAIKKNFPDLWESMQSLNREYFMSWRKKSLGEEITLPPALRDTRIFLEVWFNGPDGEGGVAGSPSTLAADDIFKNAKLVQMSKAFAQNLRENPEMVEALNSTYSPARPGARPRARDTNPYADYSDMILWYYWFIHFLQRNDPRDFGGGRTGRKKKRRSSKTRRKNRKNRKKRTKKARRSPKRSRTGRKKYRTSRRTLRR